MLGVCWRVSASGSPSYTPDNSLLEKAELLAKFSEKLQRGPNDVISTIHQSSW
jgi:hypothetical protein